MIEVKLSSVTDRRLDAQLAERLWGCNTEPSSPKGNLICSTQGHGYTFHCHTLDWNDAQRVIDKVKSLPQFGENGSILIEWMGPEWMCSIVMEDGSNGLASNLKVEHAVALAALRALGVKVEAETCSTCVDGMQPFHHEPCSLPDCDHEEPCPDCGPQNVRDSTKERET